MIPTRNSVRNNILRSLNDDAFELLRPGLDHVTLGLREPLNEPNRPTHFVYFPDTAVGSVMLGPDRTNGVEVGIVGREGFLGTSVVLGAEQSPHYIFIQIPGNGWRLPAERLRSAMALHAGLQKLLLAYIHTVMVQTASTAHANADYTVEERLARWILMCHDRVDGDEIVITHEFMALMLGVRRPGVTVATHVLEGEHMIRSKRGLITVLDREKLKTKANASYGLAEAEYERLIGEAPRTRDSNVVPLHGAKPAERLFAASGSGA